MSSVDATLRVQFQPYEPEDTRAEVVDTFRASGVDIEIMNDYVPSPSEAQMGGGPGLVAFELAIHHADTIATSIAGGLLLRGMIAGFQAVKRRIPRNVHLRVTQPTSPTVEFQLPIYYCTNDEVEEAIQSLPDDFEFIKTSEREREAADAKGNRWVTREKIVIRVYRPRNERVS